MLKTSRENKFSFEQNYSSIAYDFNLILHSVCVVDGLKTMMIVKMWFNFSNSNAIEY